MSAQGQFASVQAALGGITVDGIPGAESDAAFRALSAAALAEYRARTAPAVLPAPARSAASWPREADAAAFFGYPPNLTQIEPPYAMRMYYDAAWHPIHAISCNVKVAASLRACLAAILAHYGSLPAIQAVGLDVYDGCYNDRNVRGSSTKRSMHAYGAAIDFDAEHNPLGAPSGRMPAAVVAIFEGQGWRWGGRYSGRKDFMHFEAVR